MIHGLMLKAKTMQEVKGSKKTSSTPAGVSAVATRLRVQDATGAQRWMEFSNADTTEAMRRATARGLRVLATEALQQGDVKKTAGKSACFPLLLFTQELLALLDAGLNLTEVLVTLHVKEREAGARVTLAAILQALREGRSFSDALAAAPGNFPLVYIATVRAAERTGDLASALTRYIAYQMQLETIRKKLISTAIYPVMLLAVGGLVTLFLLGYVVPRFSVVYESSGRELPWLSGLLLQSGKLIYNNWQLAACSLLSLVGLSIWGLSRPQGRIWMLDKVLGLPWLRQRTDEFRLARFYRSVSLLLASGIALPRAMGMVTGLLSVRQQTQLARCRLAVEQGQSLSLALVQEGLASPVAESLIKVGERSGQMADMLERTARFADDDFSRWMDWASRLLEPVLMAVIGVVIGTVVVLMYMPIFELAGSLQ
jgi:general secretion pathway protein F